MGFYLVEGQSGTGKSTVCLALRRRGFRSFDADNLFSHWGDPVTRERTAKSSETGWFWEPAKVERTLGSRHSRPAFICGCSDNSHEFEHRFLKIFTLYVDADTLRHRLLTRTNNPYGKEPNELAEQMAWNGKAVEYARRRGTILIDGTKTVKGVADEILGHIRRPGGTA